MGTGKTSVAKLFSEQFQMTFVEIDALIETKAGKPIPEIFQEGEAIFRKYEADIIQQIANAENQSISCGGGAILDPINCENLAKTSTIVLLEASPSVIYARIKGEGIKQRPLLNKENPIEEIKKLLDSRQQRYRQAANVIINTDGITLEQIIFKIMENLEESLDDRATDEEFEDTFLDIREEIASKNETGEIVSQRRCKICGKLQNTKSISRCKVCNIPACKKCRNSHFCINCWINLKDDPRKTIKLTQYLALFIPVAIIFLLFQSLTRYLIANAIIISLLLSISFLTKYQVGKHPNKYLNYDWLEKTKSKWYASLVDLQNPECYIHGDLIQDYQNKKQKKIQKLKNWINMEEQMANIPVPAHYNSLDKQNDLLSSKLEEQSSLSPVDSCKQDNFDRNYEYSMIGKQCPSCGAKIEFADFCPECNIRFCPKCAKSTSPFALRCMCGLKFVPLTVEFSNWAKNDEVIFQKEIND